MEFGLLLGNEWVRWNTALPPFSVFMGILVC